MDNYKRAKTSCHCINLRRAANAITKIYDESLGEVGLSGNQLYLLVSLSETEPSSVTQLAHYVGLERSTLVRTLKPLITAGLICDTAESGQRNRVLELTDKGREKLISGKSIWNELQEQTEEKLGAENVRILEAILEQLE